MTLRRYNVFILLCVLGVLCGESASAQTGTTVTGVTKTQGQQTPAAAGLKVLKTVAATSVYGTVKFQACEVDSSGRCVRYREVTCGGVTYIGPRLGYVKGDGTWIDEAAAAGIKQVPNSGCSPAGLATEAIIELTPSVAEPIRLPASRIVQVKVIPDQASVDWTTLSPAVAATPAAGKQSEDHGSVANDEQWTCVAPATVSNPPAGAIKFFFDSADSCKAKRKDSTGTVTLVEGGGGGGSGDITDVGNCATGACFQSVTANQVFAGPSSGGAAVAAMRALVAADIPSLDASKIATGSLPDARVDDTITASNYVLKAGDVMTGNLDLDNQKDVRLRELDANGDNFLGFRAPAAVAVADEGVFELAPLPASAGFVRAGARAAGVSILSIAAIADADVPNNITIDLAALATALAANAANCAANSAAGGVDASGAAEACTPYLPLAGGTMTGAIVTAAGTLSAPALQLDTQTGLYRFAASQIGISAGNVLAARISSGGISLPSTKDLLWCSDVDCAVSIDAGLERAGAAALKVTDGSTGYGSLDANAYKVSGAAFNFSHLAGSIASGQQNNPGVGAKGGVESKTCSGTDKLSAIGTDGIPVCSADQLGAGGGDAITVATVAATDPDFIDSGTIDVTLDTAPAPDTITWAIVANSVNATHIDETVAYTWSGLHTFDRGTTPAQAILLSMAQPGVAGTRDSHFLDLTGTSFDSAGHDADWRAFVDVTSNAAASTYTLQSRIDAAAFGTRFSVGDGAAFNIVAFTAAALNDVLCLNASLQVTNCVPDADLTQIAGLTRTRGDLIVGGASAWTDLAIGGADTFLRSDGTDPAWSTIALGTNTIGNYVADVADGSGIDVTGTPGEGWTATVNLKYTDTLAGNPALNADECVFSTDGTGGGILCEGAADTIEGLLVWNPSTSDRTLTLPDATDTLVARATTDTLTNKTLAAADNVIDADTAVALAANGSNCSAGSYPLGVNASGAAESCTDYGTETKTFTGKTLDVEGTGNVVTTVSKVWLEAAACQNTTATLMWDTPTSSPAVAACITGTNTQKGVADFADGASLSIQRTLMLPADFTGTVDVIFKWLSATTTNNVVWQFATICVADAETDDPAFNTASTVTDAAKGTANQTNDAAITGVTITGCAAGELLHIKAFRDPAHASDNHAATARLVGVELTLRRAQ